MMEKRIAGAADSTAAAPDLLLSVQIARESIPSRILKNPFPTGNGNR
jgi:hypothetical protein